MVNRQKIRVFAFQMRVRAVTVSGYVTTIALTPPSSSSWCVRCLQCDDVTLGHERRPIRIDLISHLEGGPTGAVGRELLSRLRRFVYIKDCVSETDSASLLTGSSNSSKGEGNNNTSSSSSSVTAEGSLKRSGCDCVDCFANESRCPCVRLNGQRLPYVPLRQSKAGSNGAGEGGGGGGAVKGIMLEGTLSMTRTKVRDRMKPTDRHFQ
jgi:hypothetical protein